TPASTTAPSAPASSPAPSTSATTTDSEASAGPTVVVQRSQQTTPGVRHGASATGHGGGRRSGGQGGAAKQEGKGAAKHGPGSAPAGALNGVASAPQTAGDEVGALAALLSGSTVSAQALAFYRIPLFLLPVYQAAAFQYDVPWQILAAINEIETDYGTDLSVSTAGAIGWMQFMPGTWLQYGVDATDAGYADPYNPVDAIFAAARYLHAAGAAQHLRTAIYAYNHSQEYVESVLLRARLIASYPRPVIATLTGLADGRAPTPGARLAPGAIAELAARAAAARAEGSGGEGASSAATAGEGPSPAAAGGGATSATAGAIPLAPAPTSAAARALHGGNAAAGANGAAGGDGAAAEGGAANADGVANANGDASTNGAAGAARASAKSATPGSTPAPSPQAAAARARAAADAPAKPSQLVEVLGDPGKAVVAVEDGRIEHLGRSRALGRYLVLRDIYGDVFTYAGLGSIAPRFRPSVPRVRAGATSGEPTRDPAPTLPASAGHQRPLTLKVKAPAPAPVPAATPLESESENVPAGMGRARLFAHPGNPIARAAIRRAAPAHGGGWQPLRVGSIVAKGTVLGQLDTPRGASAGRLRFAVRPAGDSATIDPQPLLQNWRQLGVALHPKRSTGGDSLLGATAATALTMSKGELERAVLADPGIQLDACARHDVAAGAVDKRVLAVLVFLSRSGLQPTVAAVRCPRRGTLAGVGVASPSTGATGGLAAPQSVHDGPAGPAGPAVDIAAINDIPLAGHQGPGTVADATIRTLLTLHGQFAPRTIESLMSYPGAPATQARAAAWNRVGIEFAPSHLVVKAHAAAAGPTAATPLVLAGDISEAQWSKLIGRIAALPKPSISAAPSSAAIRDPQAAPTNRGLGTRGLGAGS
ncbi:MAG TPA: lytic murein transglycosylase, partial [Solirubrobacteraceae bacterium]|nr:lytic murein transglycosylase [Solirubrobacteraceae bacterium]